MFKVLAQMVESVGQIDMYVTGNGNALTVTVVPKSSDAKNTAMKTPLSLTASAAELEEGFAQALQTYSSARKSLAEQVAQTTALIDAAKKGEAVKAIKQTSKEAKPAAVSIDDLAADEVAGSAEAEQAGEASATQTPQPEKQSGLDLAELI